MPSGWSRYMSGGRESGSVTDSSLTMIRLYLDMYYITRNAQEIQQKNPTQVQGRMCTQYRLYTMNTHTPAKSESSTQYT